MPLNQLPADPAGGIDVDLPVNNGNGSLPLTTTGVYPVQAFLERGGARLGAPLRTFVVFAANDALRHLNVSLVVPLAAAVPISSSGSVGTLPARSAPTLRAEIADLNDWHVAATVAADVPTLEALTKGDGADQGAVAGLRAAVSSGDEVLPATSLPFDLGALVSAGLTHDIQEELAAGEVALKTSLGVSPAPTTWAFAQGVDPATAATLETMGARQLAVPEADLSGLPASDLKLTFAQPTKVSVPNGQMDVIGADSELSARIGQAAAPGQAVLVANQVLAELAMIDLEAPSDDRGVVVMPAEGTMIDPGFLAVLLAGLDGNPLIKGVTLAQIFHQVPLATVASAVPGATARPLVRQLAGPSSAAPLQGTRQLQDALNGVAADAEVYGTAAPLVGELSQELVACLSSVFSATQRAAAIGAALQSAQVALAKVRLPPVDSITLTSRQGSLPLSLQSAAGVPVHVRLVLSSEELSFVAKRFDQGSCSPEGPGFEWCQLTLTQATTALEVPVVVRTIGAFPLTLEVETPDGSRQIAGGTYTVRSTAISDLGLVLMVGAALFLAVWWARNARHGRRAKRLVPRPEDPDDIGGEPADPETAGAAAPSAAVAMLRRPASGVRPGPGHSIGPVSRPPG